MVVSHDAKWTTDEGPGIKAPIFSSIYHTDSHAIIDTNPKDKNSTLAILTIN